MDGFFRKDCQFLLTFRFGASLLSFVVLILLAMSDQSYAQSQGRPAGSQDQAPRVTTLDFEDELIVGGVTRPELLYIFQKRNFNYKPLIELRENFIPEMRRSAEQIRN